MAKKHGFTAMGSNWNRLSVEIGQQCSRRHLDIEYDHVILALPQWPLRRLAEFFPKSIRGDIEGVIGFPLLKAFLVVKRPWWKKEDTERPHRGAHLVPTRELHYWWQEGKNGSDPFGMVMLYTDRPATAYWQPYVRKPHFRAQKYTTRDLKDEFSQRLLDELVLHLLVTIRQHAQDVGINATLNTGVTVGTREIPSEMEASKPAFLDKGHPFSKDVLLNSLPMLISEANKIKSAAERPIDVEALVRTILKTVAKNVEQAISPRAAELLDKPQEEAIEDMKKMVIDFAIRDWSQPPFGAACHAWSPGVHVPSAIDRLKAFSLIGRQGVNNLHVCGEAFSDYQGFIEGALRSADKVVETFQKNSE